MKRAVWTWLLMVGLWAAPSRAITVDEIVTRHGDMLARVNSMITIMTFSVQSPSMRVPDSRVRLYYKRPDHWKPEPLEGDFTVMPGSYRMVLGNVLGRLSEGNTLRLLRTENLGQRPNYVLKATPKEDNTGIYYHLVYVDAASFTVSRMITYPVGEGQKPVSLSLGYGRYGDVGAILPNQLRIDATAPRQRDGQVVWEPMTITIRFTDYRINVPINDSVFADPEQNNRR